MLLLLPVKSIGSNVVRIEAETLHALADRIAGPMAPDFERAVDCLQSCAGRVVVTGMGKSGIIARKIAATLSSTGTPALYLHPAEAVHGDLGMLVKGDVVVALSSSGETEEILQLLATMRRIGNRLVTITGDSLYSGNGKRSTLAQAADVALPQASRERERFPRWPWPWQTDEVSKKRTLPIFIPAASWASGWPGFPSSCTPATLSRAFPEPPKCPT